MSAPPHHPSDHDLELLSAYLDDALTARERAALERRLAQDAALRSVLDELHATINLVSALPSLKAPRDFTLDPAKYGRRTPWWSPVWTLANGLQIGGALGTAAAIVLIALGLLFGSEASTSDDMAFNAASEQQAGESEALDQEAPQVALEPTTTHSTTAPTLPAALPTATVTPSSHGTPQPEERDEPPAATRLPDTDISVTEENAAADMEAESAPVEPPSAADAADGAGLGAAGDASQPAPQADESASEGTYGDVQDTDDVVLDTDMAQGEGATSTTGRTPVTTMPPTAIPPVAVPGGGMSPTMTMPAAIVTASAAEVSNGAESGAEQPADADDDAPPSVAVDTQTPVPATRSPTPSSLPTATAISPTEINETAQASRLTETAQPTEDESALHETPPADSAARTVDNSEDDVAINRPLIVIGTVLLVVSPVAFGLGWWRRRT